jgi:hypothetical protein
MLNTRLSHFFSLTALLLGGFSFFANMQPARPALSKGFSLVQGMGVVEPVAPNSPEATNANTNVFNYQGVLRKADGTLASGTYAMQIRLYSAVAGGTAMFTETLSSVTVRDGFFNVLLGDVTTNTISNRDIGTTPLFLGIQVNNETEMQPRQRIHAVPKALTLVPGAYINGGINLWNTDANRNPVHDPALIEMWSGVVPGGASHAIGTEDNNNRYGPAGAPLPGSIGHKFYTKSNQPVAEIGKGGRSGNDALFSTFNGPVGIQLGRDPDLSLEVGGPTLIHGLVTSQGFHAEGHMSATGNLTVRDRIRGRIAMTQEFQANRNQTVDLFPADQVVCFLTQVHVGSESETQAGAVFIENGMWKLRAWGHMNSVFARCIGIGE